MEKTFNFYQVPESDIFCAVVDCGGAFLKCNTKYFNYTFTIVESRIMNKYKVCIFLN
jgi:hypothetical protein